MLTVYGTHAAVLDLLATKPVHAMENFRLTIDPNSPGDAMPGDAEGMKDVRAAVWKSIDDSGRTLTYKQAF